MTFKSLDGLSPKDRCDILAAVSQLENQRIQSGPPTPDQILSVRETLPETLREAFLAAYGEQLLRRGRTFAAKVVNTEILADLKQALVELKAVSEKPDKKQRDESERAGSLCRQIGEANRQGYLVEMNGSVLSEPAIVGTLGILHNTTWIYYNSKLGASHTFQGVNLVAIEAIALLKN